MGTTIDQRVVEMRFDNRQFEENVAESIGTLGKLEQALKFDRAGENFGELTKAAANVDFSPVSDGLDNLGKSFNALEEIAIGALRNIGASISNFLTSKINELTDATIGEGWSKYEEKIASVQTIMNATGKSIEEVNEQLDRLNWYSDETSYSFTDMTSTVGKFTNVGVELEDAVSAIEGIASLTAISGGNNPEFQRATYNLSQAMGIGYLGTQDWSSLESAQMAGIEFRKILLDEAAAFGTLAKYSDGTYQFLEQTKDGIKAIDVTAENLRSTLSKKWLTKDVLLSALKVYGDFANELSIACESVGISATDFMGAIDDYMSGVKDINKIAEDAGVTVEEILPYIEKLTSAEYELGRKAFLAGQQAKTFTDAINATKDAVSTGWMNTFEYLFGNYEEAAVFFTDLTNSLWDVFAASGEIRNDILKLWSGLGGGDIFREALTNTFTGIASIVENVRDLIYHAIGIYNPLDETGNMVSEKFGGVARKLLAATKKFNEWSAKFAEFTEDLWDNLGFGDDSLYVGLGEFFSGIGSGLGIIFDHLSQMKPVLEFILGVVHDIVHFVFNEILSRFGTLMKNIREFLKEQQIITKVLEGLKIVLSPVVKLFSQAKDIIGGYTSVLVGAVKQSQIFQKIFEGISIVITPVSEKIKDLFSRLEKKINLPAFLDPSKFDTKPFLEFSDKIIPFFENVKTKLGSIWDIIKNIFKDVRDRIEKVDFAGFFEKIWGWIKETGKKIGDMISGIDFKDLGAKFTSALQTAWQKASDFFSGAGENASSFFANVKNGIAEGSNNGLWNLLKGLFIFNGAKSLLSSGGEEGGSIIERILSPITSLIEGLKEKLDEFVEDTDDDKLRDIAIAIGILAGSLLVLASIDSEKLDSALFSMAAIAGAMDAEVKWLSGLDVEKLKGAKQAGLAMIEISGALLLVSWAAGNLAKVEWGDLAKAGAALAGLTGFVTFLSFVSKWTETSGGSLVAVSFAMDLMVGALQGIALASLAFQHIKWESLEKAAIMLGLLTVFESFMSVITALTGTGGLTLIGVAFAMDLMVGALIGMAAAAAAFSKVDDTGFHNLALAMLELLGGFALITGAATLFLPGLLGISAVLLSIGATVLMIGGGIALIGTGIKAVGEGIQALGMAGLLVSLMGVADGLTKIFAGLGTETLTTALDLLVLTIGKLIEMVPSFVSGFVVGIINGITEVSEALFTMVETILPGVIDMIMTVLLGITESLNEKGGPILENIIQFVIKILAALSNNAGPLVEGLVDLVCNLFDSLKDHIPRLLTSALGFVDALLGEILKTIRTFFGESKEGSESSVGLPKLGKELSDFWKNLSPFLEGVKNLKPEDLEGVSNLAKAILAITAAEVLGGLTSWFGHGKTITEFCNDLTLFAPALKKFGQELEGVDTKVISDGTAAIANIATAFNSEIFKTGGLLQKIKGEVKNLESLGDDLVKFAPKLREFESKMTGTDPEDVAKSAKSVTTIAEAFDKNTFKTNGLAQFVKGEMANLEKLGGDLVAIAPKLREFESIMTGTKPDDVANAAKSITAIAEAFDADTFKTGGLTQFFSGETVDLGILGQQITEFAKNLTTLDPEFPAKALLAKEGMQNFATNFPTLAMSTNFSGEDFITSITNLSTVGSGISSYYETIKGIDSEQMGSVTKAMQDLFDMTANTDLSTETLSDTFAVSMSDVADAGVISFLDEIDTAFTLIHDKAVKLMEKFISGIDSKKSEAVTSFTKILSDALKEIQKKETDFKNSGSALVNQIKSAFVKGQDETKQAVKDFASSLVATVREYYLDFYNAGAYLLDGLKLGMTDRLYGFQDTMYQIADTIVTSMKEELGINSPSKVFYQIGEYTAEGFVNGMTDIINDFLQNEIETDPVIRPVLDLSDIEAGSRRLNAMMSYDLAYSASDDISESGGGFGYSSVDNSRSFGGFTFNIYPQSTDAEGIAEELGADLVRRLRLFSTI